MDLVKVSKSIGRFDWFHLDEKQVSIIFYGLPPHLERNYIVNLEYEYIDITDTEDVARELCSIYSTYIYASSQKKILEVLKWLEENSEEQYKLRREYEVRIAFVTIKDAFKRIKANSQMTDSEIIERIKNES